MIQGQANYYIGLVVAVSKDDDDRLKNEKEWHEILVDIPGVIQKVPAFPFRDELDEPKLNDKVLVLDVDPLYHSYFLYRKVKENGFIGFRSSGKMVSITPDDITIGVFGPDDNDEYPEYKDDEIPNCDPGNDGSGDGFAYIKLDKSGNIEIKTKGNSNINIAGDDGSTVTIKKASTVNIEDKSTVNIKSDSEVNVDGNTTITCKGNIALNHEGDSDNPMAVLDDSIVFGKELQNQLNTLNAKVDEVISGVNAAITQSVPVPMDGGATLKVTMLAGWMPSYVKLQVNKGLVNARAQAGMPDIANLEPNFKYIANNEVTTKGTAG
jgi:hypothetical protein